MFRAGALGLLLTVAVFSDCRAQSTVQAAEYRVKAAFLYKFAGYVEWPPHVFSNAETPMAIGVVDADALADELAEVVVGRTVDGRSVTVRKIRRGESTAGLQILFIGGSDAARIAAVLASVKGQPILTVTESENAIAMGANINFVIVGDKVRFDIAPRQAESQNLKISARMLAVARKIIASPS
jgi:YfiR/HmsC-like